MKLVLLAFAAAAAACSSPSEAAPQPQPPPSGHYCNLGVFTKAQAVRQRELSEQLHAAVTAAHELPDGYAFEFSGKLEGAGEWLDGVRRCCPTIDYVLETPSHQGPAVLRASGGAGAKAFIREEFAKLFPAP